MPNQYKPRPPDEAIKERLKEYYRKGLTDIQVTEVLKKHYDTTKYGLSVVTVRKLRKEWNILSTRQQKHDIQSIFNQVYDIRKRFPLRGVEGIRITLRREYGINATRTVITDLLKTVEPERVNDRRHNAFKRKRFWAAGVNDIWPQDQHDKWARFGLWLHAGLEAFSGEINWMKIWWTNKNPKLITKYYLDTCRRIGGVPIITQSDPGMENYGVANAHTTIRQRLDPMLAGTLQHRFAKGHNNILSETKWSVFRRDFAPGFEDLLENGVINGWYNADDTIENLLFRWIAIPWLQIEIDNWVNFKNDSAPRKQRHKILPHGVPSIICSHPDLFKAYDYKIAVPPMLLDEMETLYAPPHDPVFQLVPPAFHDYVTDLYLRIGQPTVNIDTFWTIYCTLLKMLQETRDESLTEAFTTISDEEPEEMPLLPNMMPFRQGQPLIVEGKYAYLGGLDMDDDKNEEIEYAEFSSSDNDSDHE